MTTLHVASPAGLLIARAGSAWRAEVHLEGQRLHCVAVDPERPERVYAGTEAEGLWLSHRGGDGWERALEGRQVTAVTVSAAEGGVVYAGTEPSAVLRSADGGASWEELAGLTELPSAESWSFPPKPWTHHVRWIEAHPLEPGRLYVAVEAGALLRSPDGGRTWQDRVPDGPYDTHTLRLHPQAPGRVWSAAGDGYFESADGGETWRRPQQGLDHRYVWGLAVDRGDPETLIVSSASGPGAAHATSGARSFVYRRAGDGPWQQVRAGLPDPQGTSRSALAAHPEEPGVFYAASNHGLFESRDGGQSWEALQVAWPEGFRRPVSGLALST